MSPDLPAPLLSKLSDAVLLICNVGIIYAGFLAVVAIHEFGHLIAARLCRFPVQEFRVGPFGWLSESGWQFRVQRGSLLSGRVRSRMSDGRALRTRRIALALAGPLTSIVGGTCGLYAGSRMLRSGLGGIVMDCASLSIVFGIVALIPVRVKGKASDGMNVVDWLVGKRFRKTRFLVYYQEYYEQILAALREQDPLKAKRLANCVMAFSDGVPEDNAMLSALRKVLALPDEVELASTDPPPS